MKKHSKKKKGMRLIHKKKKQKFTSSLEAAYFCAKLSQKREGEILQENSAYSTLALSIRITDIM